MMVKSEGLLADESPERHWAARDAARAAVEKGHVMAEFMGRYPRAGRIVLFACFVVSFALASGAGKKWN
jgi:hypothetical protein